MYEKKFVSIVSLIIMVSIAISVVVFGIKKGEDPNIQTSQKFIGIICHNTDEQKLCHETLKSVKDVDSTNLKAYIAVAVKAIMDSVIKALNMNDCLTIEHRSNNNVVKMALSDCKVLLQSAKDSLQLSTDMVQNNNIQGMHNRDADFKNWLSAVISFEQACIDGFNNSTDGEKIKEQFWTQSLDHVEKLTSMTLDIVTGLSYISEQFGLKVNPKPTSRRVLVEDGYPTWLSTADRKLLAKVEKERWREEITPNVVVAKDGSGQFKTILDAINAYPYGHQGRYLMYVKAGVYDEYITVPDNVTDLFIYGDGPGKTIITGNKTTTRGFTTMLTATFANHGKGFIARGITFENTAGPIGYQAVAFRNQGDMSAIISCHFVGYQDTLYAQTNRQFYRGCAIYGTIDFIFGSSTTLIQQSLIIVRKPMDNQFNTVTADGRKFDNMTTGIVIQGCEIYPDKELFPVRFQIKTYLGRPWKACSRTVVMESILHDVIDPQGWFPWDDITFSDTCHYAEYNNVGPGATVNERVKWKGYYGLISRDVASKFTVDTFLSVEDGLSGSAWLNALHVPHNNSFVKD